MGTGFGFPLVTERITGRMVKASAIKANTPNAEYAPNSLTAGTGETVKEASPTAVVKQVKMTIG